MRQLLRLVREPHFLSGQLLPPGGKRSTEGGLRREGLSLPVALRAARVTDGSVAGEGCGRSASGPRAAARHACTIPLKSATAVHAPPSAVTRDTAGALAGKAIRAMPCTLRTDLYRRPASAGDVDSDSSRTASCIMPRADGGRTVARCGAAKRARAGGGGTCDGGRG
jgi:hypothetical protein